LRYRFQLENHIWGLDRDIKAPSYIEDQPFMNLSSLEQKDDIPSAMENDLERYTNVDALRNFPTSMNSGMDKSQMSACETMLTTRIAIVQGPPGTGKTFTSISALRVMIDNLGPNDPPILVAAQTNHALDQLLNHILRFEPNILRLGGRSNKANKAILERTLFNLRLSKKIPHFGAGWRQARVQQEDCINNIKTTMESLRTERLLTADILWKNNLITAAQHKSLTSKWEGSNVSGDIAECKNCCGYCLLVANLGTRAYDSTAYACP
jgi:helicase required for RNAi-mediated heterochromatin assembly 1